MIILTTHFMDEADQLGDRIGIMHKGEIVACGTSLFLKAKFGVGYTLSISALSHDNVDSKNIHMFVRKHIKEAKLLSDVAGSIMLIFYAPCSTSHLYTCLWICFR